MNKYAPWISVFESLPKDSKRYLVVVVNGDEMYYITIRNWTGKGWLAPNTSSDSQDMIAYWTDLPETWMLKFCTGEESWVDYKNRLWAQLWPDQRKFIKVQP